MARYRTLDGGLWKHRDIRRAPLEVGWLYAYLITAEADDEGRFVADAWALSEDCFSSNHGVGEEEVEAALHYLQEAKLVLLYDAEGTRFGFLTGWFEHQYIEPGRREPSTIPPPPSPIQSWNKADSVRQQYCNKHETSLSRTHFRTAIRWFIQEQYEGNDPLTALSGEDKPTSPKQARIGQETSPQQAPEGKGKERKNDSAREENEDDDDDTPDPDSPAEVRRDVAFELQRLWPSGPPDDVANPILREAENTPPHLARMVARRVVTEYEHKKFDNWRVRDHMIRAMQKAVRDDLREGEQSGKSTADRDRREQALLEWQAEIEREDEERRKLEEAEATS